MSLVAVRLRTTTTPPRSTTRSSVSAQRRRATFPPADATRVTRVDDPLPGWVVSCVGPSDLALYGHTYAYFRDYMGLGLTPPAGYSSAKEIRTPPTDERACGRRRRAARLTAMGACPCPTKIWLSSRVRPLSEALFVGQLSTAASVTSLKDDVAMLKTEIAGKRGQLARREVAARRNPWWRRRRLAEIDQQRIAIDQIEGEIERLDLALAELARRERELDAQADNDQRSARPELRLDRDGFRYWQPDLVAGIDGAHPERWVGQLRAAGACGLLHGSRDAPAGAARGRGRAIRDLRGCESPWSWLVSDS